MISSSPIICLLFISSKTSSKNHKLWAKYIKKLAENPNLIEDLGNKLYETVKDKYSLPNVCKERVEFIKLINKK